MNFTNREGDGGRQSQSVARVADHATADATPNNTLKDTSGGSEKNSNRSGNVMYVSMLTMLFSVCVILLGVIYLLHLADPNSSRFVDRKHLQAVFLTNGQVYFGKVDHISAQYIELQGIFYLNNTDKTQTSSRTATPADLSLVKLGCELHGPYDAMVINQTQVSFWENLRDDGQVAKAIGQYLKQNPNGLNCTDSAQSSSTSQSTTTGGSSAKP